jgi:hypothetical protein
MSGTYFGETEEAAIINFINSDSTEERNEIYNEILKAPFNQMIQSILRKYPIHLGNFAMHELEEDALAHLIDKMSNFKPELITKSGKKTKAFSYCQTIVRNYFRDQSVKSYNEKKINVIYNGELSDDTVDSINYKVLIENITKKIKNKLKNVSLLDINDIIVGNTIIHMLNYREILFNEENSTKREILNYFKNYSGLSMKEIRGSINSTYKEIYSNEILTLLS